MPSASLANVPGGLLKPVAGGLRLAVRLKPKARRPALGPVARDEDGGVYLNAAVSEAPENGKANRALVRLLARTWRLAPSRIAIVTGAKSRHKTVVLAGEGKVLEGRIQQWFEESDG